MEVRGLKFTHKSIRLMGGEGSGHHGHAGRPGSIGGSAPSGSSSSMSKIAVLNVFNSKTDNFEYFVLANHIDPKNRLQIEGEIKQNDKVIGKFEYSVNSEEKSYSPTYLKMYERRTGVGTEFVLAVESDLKQLGFKVSTVSATSIGGLFWAKVGYDFRHEGDRKDAQTSFNRAFDDIYGYLPKRAVVHSLVSTQDFLNYRGPDGKDLAEAVFVNMSWTGIKYLK